VNARQVFEAAPAGAHSKADYARVMDGFRAIYHGNPSDPHAGKAIAQVAELLAEEGHELSDRKALRDAAGQYEFLAKAYPGGPVAASALGQAYELLGADAANDPGEAQKVAEELRESYPRSEAARALVVAAPAPVATSPRARLRSADAERVPDVEAAAPMVAKRAAMVTGIRHWSTPTYTRVAIDLGDEVE